MISFDFKLHTKLSLIEYCRMNDEKNKMYKNEHDYEINYENR